MAATSNYSSSYYGPSHPHLAHTPASSSLYKTVSHPAYERKFSDSMYGSAFGFLLDATAVFEELELSVSTVRHEESTVVDEPVCKKYKSARRSSTFSEKSRALPPQRPIPSQPLPDVPTPKTHATHLPSITLDSQTEWQPLTALILSDNSFDITLSPQRTPQTKTRTYTAETRPSVVHMAPLMMESSGKGAVEQGVRGA